MTTPQPSDAFPQFIPNRVREAMGRVARAVWSVVPTGYRLSWAEPTDGYRPLREVSAGEYRAAPALPFHWGSLFQQVWWRLELDAPLGEGVYLRWDDQGEATIYHDGEPWHGVDPGHTEVPLPAGAQVLDIESACMRTGIWVQGAKPGIDAAGSLFRGIEFLERNDDAWHAHATMEVLFDLMATLHKRDQPLTPSIATGQHYRDPLQSVDPLVRTILTGLNRATDMYDRQGTAALRAELDTLLGALRVKRDAESGNGSPASMAISLTGHAHIDLVWLWPERVGDFKAVHSFANALRLMERYPELTFGYSQPASYAAVKRLAPSLIDQVKDRIKAGKWDATGAMWVESDTQLPCGEALVRAFELGQAGFEELRGDGSKVVWLPDVFGYSGVLPTIMAGFGVPYFFTTKLHWSAAQPFPFSSFRWRGSDGSEVVAHLAWNHYNQLAKPSEVLHFARTHRQAGVHHEGLMPTGYGDGGGGPNEMMAERVRRMDGLAGLPETRWGNIEPFFDRLAERRDRLPLWRGEMYLELHRGVQTTHGPLKAAFRAAERGLQVWEAASCVTGGGPVGAHEWDRTVFAQFHDYIPGSSVAEVYAEHVPELEGIAARTLECAGEALKDEGGEACLFNPLPIERGVEHEGRRYVLPPLSGTPCAELEAVEAPAASVTAEQVKTDRLTARFDHAGRITELVVDGRPTPIRNPLADLVLFPDHPANYDAWDVDRPTMSNPQPIPEEADVSVEGQTLVIKRRLTDRSSAVLRYTPEPGRPWLNVDVEVDLQDPQVLLAMVLDTGYLGQSARYGAPYGSTLRSATPGPLVEDAAFEVPASRWACIADDTEAAGLMLITEAKYGFGCTDGMLHCSLLRSARVTPSNQGGENYALRAGDQAAFSDLGQHRIRLCLGGYRADSPREEQPAAVAHTAFTPVLPYTGSALQAGYLGLDGGPSLIPAWAKPLPGGDWVLRLHETLGQRGTATLRLAESYSATPVDLRDQPKGEVLSDHTLDFGPYQLISYRIAQV